MEKASSNQLKIAIIGPESSGKSTLCEQLSRHFSASWVPEFARSYLETIPNYSRHDLDYFLGQQIANEKKDHASILFCDTDPISFKIWSIYKYGTVSKYINYVISSHNNYAHRILLTPDLPYEKDPLRENSSLKQRIELFELFKQELEFHNLSYSIVDGLNENRIKNAIKTLSKLI